jgi:AraC family transcriptional regulator
VAEREPVPTEQVVYAGARVRIGAFRCPIDHPRFHDSGPIEGDVFVFPRTRVVIRHHGSRAFSADPQIVTLYNKGQVYRRDPISVDGDRCDWFRVDRTLALETARELDPSAEERPDRPFRFSHGPSDSATYFAQRELFERLAAGAPADSLEVEEFVVALLGRVLEQAHRAWRGVEPPDIAPRRADVEIVERARFALAERYDEPITLDAIASAAGVSHFRLCHAFRKRTGTTLHAYREQLRLRTALERLSSCRSDLTDLALSLGYSSHSHFSANFRRVFRMTPSAARRRSRFPGRPLGLQPRTYPPVAFLRT